MTFCKNKISILIKLKNKIKKKNIISYFYLRIDIS